MRTDFTWTVDLPVALSRPYTLDEYRTYRVVAPDWVEASLVACQIALCTSMPLGPGVVRACEF